MSAKVPYAPPPPPPKPEAPKHFAGILLGIILCIVGALVIYQGIDVAKEVEKIAPSMALLAAGALLIFSGASKVWPGKALVNVGLFIVGLACLVGSGALIADNLRGAAYAILLTIIGIALIVFGVEVAKERWKRFIAH